VEVRTTPFRVATRRKIAWRPLPGCATIEYWPLAGTLMVWKMRVALLSICSICVRSASAAHVSMIGVPLSTDAALAVNEKIVGPGGVGEYPPIGVPVSGTSVRLGVLVGAGVLVSVGAGVGVDVGVMVSVSEGVCVIVPVHVGVTLGVMLGVSVSVGVLLGSGVTVLVGVTLGVGVKVLVQVG
jgi:hypothetical protein